jgi:hypothetical protein
MFWLEANIITPKQYRREIENLITGMGGTVKNTNSDEPQKF